MTRSSTPSSPLSGAIQSRVPNGGPGEAAVSYTLWPTAEKEAPTLAIISNLGL